VTKVNLWMHRPMLPTVDGRIVLSLELIPLIAYLYYAASMLINAMRFAPAFSTCTREMDLAFDFVMTPFSVMFAILFAVYFLKAMTLPPNHHKLRVILYGLCVFGGFNFMFNIPSVMLAPEYHMIQMWAFVSATVCVAVQGLAGGYWRGDILFQVWQGLLAIAVVLSAALITYAYAMGSHPLLVHENFKGPAAHVPFWYVTAFQTYMCSSIWLMSLNVLLIFCQKRTHMIEVDVELPQASLIDAEML